jgi:hypothetical protein
MARVQLGRTLDDEETFHLVAFLNSLTGNLPETLAQVPLLPAVAFAGSPVQPAVGAGRPLTLSGTVSLNFLPEPSPPRQIGASVARRPRRPRKDLRAGSPPAPSRCASSLTFPGQ